MLVVSPPGAGPLGVSSIVMRPRHRSASPYRLRMDFVLDLLQGVGIAAAIGIRPFLPVLLAGALAARRRSGSTSTAPTSPSWSRGRSCWRRCSSRRALALARSRRAEAGTPAARVRARRRVAWCSARSRPPARSPTAGTRSSPACSLGAAAAVLGFVAARDLFARVRRRLDAEAAGALPVYAEGRRWPARASRSSSRRSPSSWSPGSCGCCWAAAAARARSTPACASCGPKKLVLAVVDAMKPAMLERAVGERPGPGDGAADRARASTSTTAWPRSRR